MEENMKNFKKIIMLLLALALCLSTTAALVSCGGGEDPCTEHVDADKNGKCDVCEAEVEVEAEGDTYTLTVTDEDGNPLAGVSVQLLLDGVAPIGAEVTTGADGKAGFSPKNEGNYFAKVTKVPAGYILPDSTASFTDGAGTFIIEALPVYTVYVKDAAGNAIEGVAVQLCSLSGACQLPKMTDAEGKIASALTPDSYKALIVSAPEGYVVPADYVMLDGNTVTIVLELE